jgi:hypothetical protein
LVARVIKKGLGNASLDHPAAWYSPSSLFLELARRAADVGRCVAAEDYGSSAEAAASATETLLRGAMSRETVKKLGDKACAAALRHLSLRVCAALVAGDEAQVVASQRALATAATRWACLRAAPDAVSGPVPGLGLGLEAGKGKEEGMSMLTPQEGDVHVDVNVGEDAV